MDSPAPDPPIPVRRDSPGSGTEGYAADLAFVHHAGFGDWARAAATTLLAELSRAGFHRGTVVDLGCGSGILAARVTAVGFDVLGADRSLAMLSIARASAPRARFVHASIHEIEIPEAVAVTAIGEVLNHTFDRRTGVAGLQTLLHAIHASLAPGGFFLFDVATPGRVGVLPREAFHEGSDWSVYVRAEEDADYRTLARLIVTFRRVGGLYRRTEERHELQLFDRDEVLAALEAASFGWKPLVGYHDLRLGPGMCVGMATRREPMVT